MTDYSRHEAAARAGVSIERLESTSTLPVGDERRRCVVPYQSRYVR